jgi:hypothetical protein
MTALYPGYYIPFLFSIDRINSSLLVELAREIHDEIPFWMEVAGYSAIYRDDLLRLIIDVTHLTQEPKSQERDPAPASNDPNALEQASRRSRKDSTLVEGRHNGSGNEGRYHQDTCDKRVERPTFPIGITREAPRHHKTGSSQRAEGDDAIDAMNGSVERLGTTCMRTRRVAQARVGHEDASYHEAYTEDAKQNWSPNGTPTRSKDLPEPYGEAEREQPTDKEVGDLHPPLVAQAQTASIVVPRAVAGSSGSFDQ